MVAEKKAAKKKVVKKAKKSSSSSASLDVPAVLDISCASGFFADLKKAVSSSDKLVLNAKGVEKITTPGIQLLIAADLTMQDKKGSLSLSDASDEMQAAFSDLGLSSQFNEWNKNDG